MKRVKIDYSLMRGKDIKDLRIHEVSLVVHPKDHEPDWYYDVCRMCGLGRLREVTKDDGSER